MAIKEYTIGKADMNGAVVIKEYGVGKAEMNGMVAIEEPTVGNAGLNGAVSTKEYAVGKSEMNGVVLDNSPLNLSYCPEACLLLREDIMYSLNKMPLQPLFRFVKRI